MTSHILPTYARYDLEFERGEGAWLISTKGERYLDFASGVAVNVLGHAHPRLVAALTEQAQKVWHVSNYYRIPGGERLAERLCALSFADKVFFCNSGAEAAECSIKTARKYFAAKGAPERYRIITFEGAFHGRTLATLAAGGQKKYLEGFGPVVEGFDQVAFGDVEAVKRAITRETAAIFIEPIQGEGGLRVAPPGFLKELRALCDRHGLLLVLDEIQTGIGRTGDLFAYQKAGVTPDIMAIAKAIGGGFPVGACLATDEAAKGMVPGTHGSTFGGNPLAMAVANAVLDVVCEAEFMPRVREIGLRFARRLGEIKDRFPDVVAEVRGQGLMLGLRCIGPNTQLIDALRLEMLLAIPAGDNVVRLFPPLVITDTEIGEACERLSRACAEIARASRKGRETAG